MQTSARVVLVQDDEDIRIVAEKALRGSGYEVFGARDGESGLLHFNCFAAADNMLVRI